LKSRENSQLKEYTSRNGEIFYIDENPDLCIPFGFNLGDTVKDTYFGTGKVIGTFGGKIYFQFDGEEISTFSDCSLQSLQSTLMIIKREKKNDIFRGIIDGHNVNIDEKRAPKWLTEYNFNLRDVVNTEYGIGFIKGTLGYNVIVEIFCTKELKQVSVFSLTLIRRLSKEDVIVNKLSFSNKVIPVLVNFTMKDSYYPYDRILTDKGLATVIGKNITKDGYWIQTDDALKLNLGLVETKNTKYKIIRRIGYNEEFSIINYGDKFYPGDIVEYNMKFYIVKLFPSPNIIIFNSNEELELNLGLGLEINCISRSGFPFKRECFSINHILVPLDLQIEHFRGMRVLPGDIISTPNGKYCVMGLMNSESIWVKNEDSNNVFTLTFQAFYDPNLIRVIDSKGSFN